MKDQQEEIDRIEVIYIGERGELVRSVDKELIERIRLSVWITADDSHHIEIRQNESRYRLSGLLHRLAESISTGV